MEFLDGSINEAYHTSPIKFNLDAGLFILCFVRITGGEFHLAGIAVWSIGMKI